ncbi:hypothetical protein R3O65_01775 [Corynebacterium pseudodiphtheriticum]|uniref:hypothetical protein n=1 Tax=Corynebacterium pseudodiphtheriticum TaxID=37637 RepID=UPI0025438267|nr:hypothetical protein [Corynebacterium pseudodiphtheriticum]MDK4278039.1 hypothetical protein [Corynebacterium pseudodiphtheriticum]
MRLSFRRRRSYDTGHSGSYSASCSRNHGPNPSRRQVLAGVLLSASVGLAACGNEETGALLDSTWQITHIYSAPEDPTEVPTDIAGVPRLGFSQNSMAGYTGCAPLQAQVSFSDDSGTSVAASEASFVLLNEVISDEIDTECTGTAAWIHSHIAGLLQSGNRFALHFDSRGELVMQLDDGQPINSPALRMFVL